MSTSKLAMSDCTILLNRLFLRLLVLLLYKFVSSLSAALPSFFTSGSFTIFLANLRILPRSCSCCCTAGHHQRLFFGAGFYLCALFSSIFGATAVCVDLLFLNINILLFDSLACIGLALFTIIILSRGGIFFIN